MHAYVHTHRHTDIHTVHTVHTVHIVHTVHTHRHTGDMHANTQTYRQTDIHIRAHAHTHTRIIWIDIMYNITIYIYA